MQDFNFSALLGTGLSALGSLCFLIYRSGIIVERISGLDKRVNQLDKRVEKIDYRVTHLDKRLDAVIGPSFVISYSPMQLNEVGAKIISDSDIDKILEPLFDSIVEQVRSLNPANAYQAQQHIIDAVKKLREDESYTMQLENGAFMSGRTVDEVLFAGAIYIRDRILEKLGLYVAKESSRTPDSSNPPGTS